ncbi:MAG: hypothetical protein FJW81_00650 [Actinobacteria bacterium]|nr:hypothetical protein [Actinomycetota bacterium]
MTLLAAALIVIGLVVIAVTLRDERDVAAIGIAAGGLALASAGLTGLISSTTWNPSDALRVGAGAVAALAWVAALGAGTGGLMRGDRRRGGAALALAGLTAVAAIALASAAG